MRPEITIHDAETGETVTREMTEAEYAELLAIGWSETNPDEVPE
jgi:hypothetical protein